MNIHTIHHAFFCPSGPLWSLDWDSLVQTFPWLQRMAGVPQNPIYHAEGDVQIHTRMVAESLISQDEWRQLSLVDQTLLFAAALWHDVGKPLCTKIEEDGKITSRGHARKGEQIARQLLWTGEESTPILPFAQREYIAALVRFHGLPLQFLDKYQPERMLLAASLHIRLDHLALLAEADVYGRICADQQELLTRVELFRSYAQELGCYTQPYPFANRQGRFVYFQKEQGDPTYEAYEQAKFEVVLLSGLPGAGKDTWIRSHLAEWPMVSLDSIRQELKIDAEGPQGLVIQTAKERARTYLRRKQSFVWNATNISKQLRQPLIELFTSYGASTRIVYLEAPFTTILQRNRERAASVPEAIIYKLLHKLEVPDLTEAQQVDYYTES
ncbi:AAA family ATPase [Tengunoibacter tsumagoiensis]|uniref:HD domain-containing protein n=1 Tax=Tengunoibacter tsumagoiensis TaxID=2014871 RepID=A0A401ZXJ0_9CHLR|nr:AAA family ATPase [Tengunoibacter tsumagoiensis]GCE11561.1 hypothetical protein KTT_14200 [Tengunoibacter tsumagoiensis]